MTLSLLCRYSTFKLKLTLANGVVKDLTEEEIFNIYTRVMMMI